MEASKSKSQTGVVSAAGVLTSAAAFSGVFGIGSMSWLDTINAVVLLVAAVAGMIVLRTSPRMASSPAMRIGIAFLFVCAALLLSPLFHRLAAMPEFSELDRWTQIAILAPPISMLALWMLSRFWSQQTKATAGTPDGGSPTMESFLCAPFIRLNLILAAFVALCVNAGLGGIGIRVALVQGVIVAASIMAIPALLRLVSIPQGLLALNVITALALLTGVWSGSSRYIELMSKIQEQNRLLLQGESKAVQAQQLYAESVALNSVLKAHSPAVRIETGWAEYAERQADAKTGNAALEPQRMNEYEQSLVHWRVVADQSGIDGNEFLPIRRVLCKMGDSLNAWRRLIYRGFPGINDPEIAPGILAFTDSPHADLRGRLLSALLAWERNAPEAECRHRLEAVQKLLPNEPTTYNLLNRLNKSAGKSDVALWLPEELIVGPNLSESSMLGAIADFGAVDTLVMLDSGRWEMGLNARGTPLHEEWPIVKMEFYSSDGEQSQKFDIGQTQVTHIDFQDVPFTFNVKRGNLYHIKIIFMNREEAWENGGVGRRGLAIKGLSFRKAKE